MKKFIIILLLVPVFALGQNKKTKNLLAEIEGQYSLDESGYVTYQKIIEVPETSKDVLFSRAETHVAITYNDANSVIQSKDKDTGILIGKGIYGDIFTFPGIFTAYCSFSHNLRIDCKDNKARISISLTELKEKRVASGDAAYMDFKISEIYPLKLDGKEKNITGQAFYYAHKRVLADISTIEDALKGKGNISDEW